MNWRFHLRWVALWGLAGSLPLGVMSAPAQTVSTAAPNANAVAPLVPPADQDPLLTLMATQPFIDTTGPVRGWSEFDPPVVSVGRRTVYRVKVGALLESIEWPTQLPTPPGLTVRPGARGVFLERSGANRLSPDATSLYVVRAEKPGVYTIPSFAVKAYGRTVQVPAATVTVVDSGADQGPDLAALRLEFVGSEFYVGQAVVARVICPVPPGGNIQAFAQVQVQGDGLIVDRNAVVQRVETVTLPEGSLPAFVVEMVVTPIRPGGISVTAQGYTYCARPAAPAGSTNTPNVQAGGLVHVLVDTDPKELMVKPLPTGAQRPGFTGAIGVFSLEPPHLSTNHVRVGVPVSLSVMVRGQGNLERIVSPSPASSPAWRSLAEPQEAAPSGLIRQRGFATLRYTFTPVQAGEQNTPPIPFSYFDPATGRYVDLMVPGVPVHVERAPGSASDSKAPTRSARGRAARAPVSAVPLALGALANAPGRTVSSLLPAVRQPRLVLLQFVLPATLLSVLWAWHCRRRFHQLHPEVLIRRRARRAMHRHWRFARQADRRGDALGFATHAIGALREACAPSVGARPQALACADLIACLRVVIRDDGFEPVVRGLFSAMDQCRFGGTQPEAASVLALRTRVERLLMRVGDEL